MNKSTLLPKHRYKVGYSIPYNVPYNHIDGYVMYGNSIFRVDDQEFTDIDKNFLILKGIELRLPIYRF